jgi:hypothetical protein
MDGEAVRYRPEEVLVALLRRFRRSRTAVRGFVYHQPAATAELERMAAPLGVRS